MRIVDKMLTRDGAMATRSWESSSAFEGQDGPDFRASSSVAGRTLLRQIPKCDATVNLGEGDGLVHAMNAGCADPLVVGGYLY
jgi:hypothetical protein